MRDWLTIRNSAGALLMVLAFAAGFGIPALLLVVVAACCFSKSLSEVAARPFSWFVDLVYFGNNQLEPPPVSLKLPRIYRQELRHADAISECERQLEYHPRSLELWTEMICSARESGDAESAERFRRKALRKLKANDRVLLDQEISSPGAWGRHGDCKALR